jgi:hypothetical protein
VEVGTFVAVARHLNGNAYECRLASCTFTTAEATALSPPASVKGVLGFLALLIALSQIGILLVVIWGRWFRRDHTPDIGAPGVVLGGLAFGFLGMFIGPTLLAVFFALLQAWRQPAKPNQRSGSRRVA